jgi:tetratricopeptide (TPR) repeat protein
MSRWVKTGALAYLAAATLVAGLAFGQGRGGPTGPPGGGAPGGGTAPGPGSTTGSAAGNIPGRTNIPTQPSPTTQPNPNMQPQTPIFISGRVMLEDGGELPGQVTIERVCSGNPHAEAYTDAKGYFSFQLGGGFQNGVMQDASESSGWDAGSGMGGGSAPMGRPGMGGMGAGGSGGNSYYNRYMNCELRARLAGYRSQVVLLANRQPLDNPDIGVILLHRENQSEEGSTISAISAAAPKNAHKAFQKGQEAEKKKKVDEAAKEYEKAVALYPKYASAWFQLGIIQADQKQTDAARKSFEAAVQADPKYVQPYLELSVLALREQKWQDVAATSQRAAKLDPFDYPQAFLFNAVANYNLKNVDAAEKSAREAERLDTRHQFPQASHLLGVILAQRHDYTGAADKLRNYLKFAPNAADASTVRSQLEQIDKMTAQAGPAAPPKQ